MLSVPSVRSVSDGCASPDDEEWSEGVDSSVITSSRPGIQQGVRLSSIPSTYNLVMLYIVQHCIEHS